MVSWHRRRHASRRSTKRGQWGPILPGHIKANSVRRTLNAAEERVVQREQHAAEHNLRVSPGPSATDWIGAASAAVTAVVALAALIAAFRQIGEAKAARKLTRDLDRARSQPSVVMFFEPKDEVPEAFDLVVRNFGETSATDVRMEITPWPRRAGGQHDPGNSDDRVKLPDVIRTLAPGQELRVFWDVSHARIESDLPNEHEAVVTFLGLDGIELSSRSYLDWRTFLDRSFVLTKSIHNVGQSLESMDKTIAKWNESISGKLSVVVRSGPDRDDTERQRYRRLMSQHGQSITRRTPSKRRRPT